MPRCLLLDSSTWQMRGAVVKSFLVRNCSVNWIWAIEQEQSENQQRANTATIASKTCIAVVKQSAKALGLLPVALSPKIRSLQSALDRRSPLNSAKRHWMIYFGVKENWTSASRCVALKAHFAYYFSLFLHCHSTHWVWDIWYRFMMRYFNVNEYSLIRLQVEEIDQQIKRGFTFVLWEKKYCIP